MQVDECILMNAITFAAGRNLATFHCFYYINGFKNHKCRLSSILQKNGKSFMQETFLLTHYLEVDFCTCKKMKNTK